MFISLLLLFMNPISNFKSTTDRVWHVLVNVLSLSVSSSTFGLSAINFRLFGFRFPGTEDYVMLEWTIDSVCLYLMLRRDFILLWTKIGDLKNGRPIPLNSALSSFTEKTINTCAFRVCISHSMRPLLYGKYEHEQHIIHLSVKNYHRLKHGVRRLNFSLKPKVIINLKCMGSNRGLKLFIYMF